jgi:RNA polymerase sigma-70 factor (sigma-E family)
MTEGLIALTTSDAVVRESFDDLYGREYGKLVRMAAHLLDDTSQAEEVVQEAWAALYVRYSRVNNPAAYARVSVLNGCRRALRRRMLSRRQPAASDEHTDLGYNHIFEAVRSLPARQRNVVLLRFDQQLSESEIACTLGIPVGTVKSTLHRALARLRTEISE